MVHLICHLVIRWHWVGASESNDGQGLPSGNPSDLSKKSSIKHIFIFLHIGTSIYI